MSKIKDSGKRRTFDTGAQRDRGEKKGLPTLISPIFIRYMSGCYTTTDGCEQSRLFAAHKHIYDFLYAPTNEDILRLAAADLMAALAEHVKGEHRLLYGRIYPHALRALSMHLENGAEKYSARNWEKGMPCEEYLNSLLRHLWSWIEGETDEPHPEAAVFNLMGFIHTREMVKRGLLPEGLALTLTGYVKEQSDESNA